MVDTPVAPLRVVVGGGGGHTCSASQGGVVGGGGGHTRRCTTQSVGRHSGVLSCGDQRRGR